jgi:hypothetical protein
MFIVLFFAIIAASLISVAFGVLLLALKH